MLFSVRNKVSALQTVAMKFVILQLPYRIQLNMQWLFNLRRLSTTALKGV